MATDSTGLVAGNPINDPEVSRVRTRSRFPLGFPVNGTYRFGEYGPHFYFEGVPNDKNVELQSRHDVRSYTMKAPLMSSVRMNKDYFLVYLDAILPRQADRLITNPTIGDDVDALEVNAVVQELPSKLESILYYLKTNVESTQTTVAGKFEWTLKMLFILETFFSSGSLLASLGCHLDALYTHLDASKGRMSFDDVFDDFFDTISSEIETFSVTAADLGGFARVRVSGVNNDPFSVHEISLNQFLEFARENHDWSVSAISFASGVTDFTHSLVTQSDVRKPQNQKPINFLRPLAYQLACAQYFTNDRVDYVYDAELFRQIISALWADSGVYSATSQTFSWNGLDLEYDILSGHFLNQFFLLYSSYTQRNYTYLYAFTTTVLSFRRSLRFVDYFTGSRPQPLAVGDSNIQVNNGYVNVIDVVHKTQAARFRNAVMRTGRRIGNYLSEILGASQRPDYHNPFFIGRTTDTVGSVETENTGDLQYQLQSSVTSTLRSASSRYAFQLDVDRYCVIIGVTSFDIPRLYCRGIDRFYNHVDRFDMFNPFMQFVGDQEVFKSERDAWTDNDEAHFGYQSRYAEYKQRYGNAFGGFVENLPGWAFLADESRVGWHSVEISPDFIRSSPSELDPFFVSLTGHSLGSYFHFIIANNNSMEASRPMAFNPQLL